MGKEGGKEEGGREGGKEKESKVGRAGTVQAEQGPSATCAHRHTIPWELAPSTAVCKQSLPPLQWPHLPTLAFASRGNPRSSLGQGLADVREKGRLPLLIRILQTMG